MVPLLEAAGHRVLAPSLTGYGDKAHLLSPKIGLGTHIDDVAGLIEDEHLYDVVLVGHSYAGMVISGVANRVPKRIAHLVFLDAMVPEDGETAVDVLPVTKQLIDLAVDGWRGRPMPEHPQMRLGIRHDHRHHQPLLVNGTAKDAGYAAITPIWADDAALGKGLKINVSEVLHKGLSLC